jgi:hypothetical protein
MRCTQSLSTSIIEALRQSVDAAPSQFDAQKTPRGLSYRAFSLEGPMDRRGAARLRNPRSGHAVVMDEFNIQNVARIAGSLWPYGRPSQTSAR